MKWIALALLCFPVAAQTVPVHAAHRAKFGAGLQCTWCHAPTAPGSVTLKAPGPEQCKACHTGDMMIRIAHVGRGRSILVEFSHARHVDAKERIDPKTGFRADCSFCHKDAAKPTHEQCAACHSRVQPLITKNCLGCHRPEETGTAVQAAYPGIAFSHGSHPVNCTVCHYSVPKSASLSTLELPKMADCARCHDAARTVPAEYRTSNCKTCHLDTTHTQNVKPAFHTEAFRTQHAAEAAAPGAKCFVCHQNVRPSAAAKLQCAGCHAAMRPDNHTARWKDDLHGKYAAMDRTTCATCHTAAYCSDCHNELPRSHQPLPLFKAGSHALAARLSLRTCFTCHTFQNTCSECHINKLQ